MPVALRKDFDGDSLRAVARKSRDGGQARRLLALAAIYDGAKRIEAAKIGGVTRQIVRDWVVRFNAQGPNGLIDRKAPGQARLAPFGAERSAHRLHLHIRRDLSSRRQRRRARPATLQQRGDGPAFG
jgi:hypothetical protein